ncbi:glycoside hydrolase family 73 protein [Streptococcus pseudoporcinus]|uniref:Gametolysin n=1 Tax=Streptococcus pseudoporcinus LQ 940-04 TaxID=875093 RepID=G5K6Y0_9STRE|nr:glycoside hydrolase family 73 protein [Streptococcus pseudoporcinus]EFR44151.1 mannosyl-glycoprotein endo-beta-N-acetylglucosaminidase [Streptococcus pseudoporcinus SPIN 20026]EHI65925.1 gametolysin [Streptococcus pseudoporcinus LQ 940-04]VEF94676.1 mannosyl-glycoprotein endo-beta-N-acetylglucosaminidase family protein [Streptococcus pseudoporcinus]
MTKFKLKGKKLLLGIFALVALVAIFAVGQSSPKEKKVEADSFAVGPTQAFINEIAGTASQIASERDLYASVMIAQAILESSNGQSGLSQAPYYNFFGIKGAYNGGSVTMKTWEDDGKGNPYEIDQPFRAYPSIADSLNDYANLLSSPLYSGAHRSNTLSYQDATAALTGLYATDTSYNAKLNSIIQTYGLTAYDVVTPAPGSQPAAAAPTATVDTTNLVWNQFRGSYTDSETLRIDHAWAALKYNR